MWYCSWLNLWVFWVWIVYLDRETIYCKMILQKSIEQWWSFFFHIRRWLFEAETLQALCDSDFRTDEKWSRKVKTHVTEAGKMKLVNETGSWSAQCVTGHHHLFLCAVPFPVQSSPSAHLHWKAFCEISSSCRTIHLRLLLVFCLNSKLRDKHVSHFAFEVFEAATAVLHVQSLTLTLCLVHAVFWFQWPLLWDEISQLKILLVVGDLCWSD